MTIAVVPASSRPPPLLEEHADTVGGSPCEELCFKGTFLAPKGRKAQVVDDKETRKLTNPDSFPDRLMCSQNPFPVLRALSKLAAGAAPVNAPSQVPDLQGVLHQDR